MPGILACLSALAVANLGYPALFSDSPDYAQAIMVTWYQAWALFIYYFIWAQK